MKLFDMLRGRHGAGKNCSSCGKEFYCDEIVYDCPCCSKIYCRKCAEKGEPM